MKAAGTRSSRRTSRLGRLALAAAAICALAAGVWPAGPAGRRPTSPSGKTASCNRSQTAFPTRRELELAKAAKKMGVPFIMGTASFTLEKIAEVGGNLWFQLYLWEKRELSHSLIGRASSAGYDVLVVTADFGLRANREYNRRNGFSNPFKPTYPAIRDILLRPRWFANVAMRYLMNGGIPKQANNPPEAQHLAQPAMRAETITWDDFARLRDIWPGKVLVKGIVRADDAALAVANGADGVVVSNHGGRNLDSTLASLDALPEIVREIGSKATVLLDSGIRRGSDMIKAYALGARAVLVGRAPLWGVACGGRPRRAGADDPEGRVRKPPRLCRQSRYRRADSRRLGLRSAALRPPALSHRFAGV
jgi:isopentenyl diphosphate isomerase/L-lactate dehydrogenase-like FMN-dependent dehydrogenase